MNAQDEYSLLVRDAEAELLPAPGELKLGLRPYFPLAGGLLSGKHGPDDIPEGTRFAASQGARDNDMTPDNWRRVEALTAFARRRGHTLLELAFSRLAAPPTVSSVIAGATEQIMQNVRAAGWTLDAGELEKVGRITGEQAATA